MSDAPGRDGAPDRAGTRRQGRGGGTIARRAPRRAAAGSCGARGCRRYAPSAPRAAPAARTWTGLRSGSFGHRSGPPGLDGAAGAQYHSVLPGGSARRGSGGLERAAARVARSPSGGYLRAPVRRHHDRRAQHRPAENAGSTFTADLLFIPLLGVLIRAATRLRYAHPLHDPRLRQAARAFLGGLFLWFLGAYLDRLQRAGHGRAVFVSGPTYGFSRICCCGRWDFLSLQVHQEYLLRRARGDDADGRAVVWPSSLR